MIRILEKEEALRALEESGGTCEIDPAVAGRVSSIIERVRSEGDEGLMGVIADLGDPEFRVLEMDDPEVEKIIDSLDSDRKRVIDEAASNIGRFAEAAARAVRPFEIDFGTHRAGMRFQPVEKAGCYIPGGRYPLPSTALMTVLTARAAGVKFVAAASPSVAAETVYAARVAGADAFYVMGGAQAVAAMALGAQSVERVDVIAGPGNAYVTEAKRQLRGEVGIDMLAGPSEVAIIADSGARPDWLALDVLAQLEHDPDARAWLFTDDAALAKQVAVEIENKARELALPEFVEESIGRSAIMVLEDLPACAAASDRVAPEHLELQVADPGALEGKLSNYGALFKGYPTTVPLGDYSAGPNHTLPTGGTARFSGGLTPLAFMRPQGWVEAGSGDGLFGNASAFAEMEGLRAHSAAARARMEKI